jgi:DNA invertase Pin-like site-specific DNA recombinase
VIENQESTKRQYALRERAVALGWPTERIHVIDSDQGQSGSQTAGRDGFTELVNKVAMGEVGIVLGLEVSRLARNNADWHRLLELAGLSGTLILDEDGVYDPVSFNDRLLLGLKGAMSEAELHVLKARLQGGIRNKAKRGELEVPLPVGYVYRADKVVVFDPDQSIQAVIGCVFEQFRENGSAMSVVKHFKNAELLFPRRLRQGLNKGDTLWGQLGHARVLQMLHNPRYAGAYVYGRSRTRRGVSGNNVTQKLEREHWQVLIQDAHEGYIDWQEFERNQRQLSDNAGAFVNSRRGSVPRQGTALLQGRVICGRCGERMRVRYQERKSQTVPYYQCNEAAVRKAGKLCQSVRGDSIDALIGAQILNAIEGSAPKIALAVHDEIKLQLDKNASMRAQHLERARYQADLAQRRYIAVDPNNRLVADSLEADWNEQLRLLDQVQRNNEEQDRSDQSCLSDEQRRQITALSNDFPTLWNDERIDMIERKRLVGLLIEDVTLTLEDKVRVGIRYRGGRTEILETERAKKISDIKRTPQVIVDTVDKLLENGGDDETAKELLRLGHTNYRGLPYREQGVRNMRNVYSLKSHFERVHSRGYKTQKELAAQFNVTKVTISKWAKDGLFKLMFGRPGTKYRLYEPVPDMIIKRDAVGRILIPDSTATIQPVAKEIV